MEVARFALASANRLPEPLQA